jgi:hypothetical protein
MHHLQCLAEPFDAARYETRLALWQRPLDETPLHMEEHEIEPPRIVFANDLVGGLRVAARARPMLHYAHLQRGDRSSLRAFDGRFGPPVDDARRQMPQQIEHARLGDARRHHQRFLQKHHHARPDAGQAFSRAE